MKYAVPRTTTPTLAGFTTSYVVDGYDYVLGAGISGLNDIPRVGELVFHTDQFYPVDQIIRRMQGTLIVLLPPIKSDLFGYRDAWKEGN